MKARPLPMPHMTLMPAPVRLLVAVAIQVHGGDLHMGVELFSSNKVTNPMPMVKMTRPTKRTGFT